MPAFGAFLKAVFYTPLLNALVALYNVIPGHDIGLAIILLTAAIRLLTIPLTASSIRSQKAMQDIQPKLKALQEQYKEDKETLAKETMALYAKEKVNPFASCLPLLVQLPFLIGLYRVMLSGLSSKGFEVLYPFVQNPGTVNAVAFGGLLNLAAPSWILALAAGGSQFIQTKMMSTRRPPPPPTEGKKDEDMLAIMNKQMLYMTPLLTTVIAWRLPAGLAVYWLTTNALAIAQQWWMFKRRG